MENTEESVEKSREKGFDCLFSLLKNQNIFSILSLSVNLREMTYDKKSNNCRELILFKDVLA